MPSAKRAWDEKATPEAIWTRLRPELVAALVQAEREPTQGGATGLAESGGLGGEGFMFSSGKRWINEDCAARMKVWTGAAQGLAGRAKEWASLARASDAPWDKGARRERSSALAWERRSRNWRGRAEKSGPRNKKMRRAMRASQ